VQASIIQVTSSQYQLVLTATDDNVAIVTSSVSGTDVLQALGVTDGAGVFLDELQAAKPAIFKFDGVTLTRNTNDVSDIISGVTFSLLQETAAPTPVRSKPR
jgi:flagellar hook-associated protein 2